ncbi:6496_t:CDS:2 [Dentiscutata erythropus]|uniref:6496_t:CDS:1 n=1 Tax=Dentiscutata erythropus TaxID=1348616 RepID=A0A9N9JIF0_9GLOM|nr:6496_t:CDS:2 [Dentiscutata erythropus]
MSSRILRSKVDKRKYESDNDDDLNRKSRKEKRQRRITKSFVIIQIDNFIKDISNQKHKASNETKCIYNHGIELFEDLKKIFELTNKDNSSVFAFYRNFQDNRKESVKEIKKLCKENQRLLKEIDELNKEIMTLNDQYLNEVAENKKMRSQIEELAKETKRLEEELRISRETSKALSTERSEIAKRINNVLRKKESAENRIRELEEQHKEDLNSRDFTFELKNQIVLLRQKVMDLETSLRNISKRRLNQSTGSNWTDNETSEHVESNSSSEIEIQAIY